MKEIIERLHSERVNAWEEQKKVAEAAVKEGRALTAEDQQVIERTDQAIDDLDRQIKDWQDREVREAEAATARAAYEGIVRPNQERAGAPTGDDAVEAEVRAFLNGERRAIELNMRQVAAEKRAIRAGAAGRELRDLVVGTAAAGGNLVPTSFLRQLYDFLEVYSGMRRTNVRILTTASGENFDLPRVASHGTAAIVGEGTALAENDPTFGKVTLGAFKYGQLLQVSHEMATDSGVDLMGFVAEDCGRALARVTDTAYVNGAGGANAPQGAITAYATGVTGQNGATGQPSYDNLIDMVYSVNEEYRQRGAQWFWRDATTGSIRKIKDTTGRPLWEPGLQPGAPDRLLGFPVVTDPNVAALATGVVCGAFGDFSGFVIRDVEAIRFERSDDFAFDKDLITFRSILRTDSDVLDASAVRVYRGGTA